MSGEKRLFVFLCLLAIVGVTVIYGLLFYSLWQYRVWVALSLLLVFFISGVSAYSNIVFSCCLFVGLSYSIEGVSVIEIVFVGVLIAGLITAARALQLKGCLAVVWFSLGALIGSVLYLYMFVGWFHK